MRELDARVTGFDYTTFHAYTTEVEVDGRTWTLGIRYNTFFQFYTRLTALEKHFKVDFPPKGGLFFSPPPEERQEQLDDFLLSTLAYFDMRGHPKRMETLLGELLQIPQHMDIKDDEERTASEGSSVAEELLLDTPMPGHEDQADDFDDLESREDHTDEEHNDEAHVDNNDVQDDRDEEDDNAVEDKPEVEVIAATEPERKQEVTEIKPMPRGRSISTPEVKHDVAGVEPTHKIRTKSVPEQNLVTQSREKLTGGAVARNYIEMLRRKTTLVNGAMQAAVVVAMQQNVEKAKAVKLANATEEKEPVEVAEMKAEASVTVAKVETQEDKPETPELEEKPEAPMAETLHVASVVGAETAKMEPEIASTTETPVSVSAADMDPSEVQSEATTVTETNPETPSVEKELALASTAEAEVEQSTTVSAEEAEDESSVDEDPAEPSPKESEAENPVMNWFRRMGTFGQSPIEKEAATKKEEEETESAAQAQVEVAAEAARAKAEAEAQEAREKAEAEAEATEAKLLHAEQEMNLRLMRYRHPVFFQNFNCDVGTSRYSLPERRSDGIVV